MNLRKLGLFLIVLLLLVSPVMGQTLQPTEVPPTETAVTEEIAATEEAVVTLEAEPPADSVTVYVTNEGDEVPPDDTSGGFNLNSFLLGVFSTAVGGILGLTALIRVIMSSPILIALVEGAVKNVPLDFVLRMREGAQGLREVAAFTDEVFDGVPAVDKVPVAPVG